MTRSGSLLILVKGSAAMDGLLWSLTAGFEDGPDHSLSIRYLSINNLYARTYTRRSFVESSYCQGV